MAVVLDAPNIFQLTPGDGSVTIDFSLLNGSPFTDVLYATNGKDFLSLGATGGPVTITKESDGVTDLVNDTGYTIQLLGVSDDYPLAPDTLRSPYGFFKPVAAPVMPSSPILLSTAPADGAVMVEYTLGDNGGSAVTAIYYTTDNGVTFAELEGPVDGNATITTLSDGVTPIPNDQPLVFQIVAVNAVETLPENNSLTKTAVVTPALASVPADSPNITGYEPGDAQLNIIYDLGSNGGSDFITVYYSTDDGKNWTDSGATSGIVQILTTSEMTGPLVNGTAYQVRLLVTTIDYPFPDPNINFPSTRVDMKPVATPVAPDAPTIGPWTAGDQMLTVSYELGSNGGSPVTNVYYSTDNGTTWYDTGSTKGNAVISALSTDGSTPLDNGTTYQVQLVAITADFRDEMANPPSTPAIGMTPSTGTIPPSVVNFEVSAGDASLEITYSLDFTGGSPLTKILYSTDGGKSWADSGDTTGFFTTKTQSSGPALENGTTYYILLVAVTLAYPDYTANPIPNDATPATPLAGDSPPTAPNAPQISKVAIGDATFTLVYTIPSDGGSAVTDVLYSTDGGDTWYTTGELFPFGTAVISAISADGTTPLTNGDPGYYVRLVAVTDAFPSTSNLGSVILPITTSATSVAPGAPSIGLVNAKDGKVQIDYTLGSDGGSPVTDVQYTTDQGVTWLSTGNISGTAVIATDSAGDPLINLNNYVFNLVQLTTDFSDPAVNPWSTDVPVTPTTDNSVPPNAPVINTYTPGDGQLEVVYSLDSAGSGTLAAILYSTDGLAWNDTGIPSGSFIMTTDSYGNPLVNGQVYNVRLVAITTDYFDPAVNTPSEVVPMTPNGGAPVSPTPPFITSWSPGDTFLTVKYKLGTNGGSYYTKLWYSTNDGGDWAVLPIGNLNESETINRESIETSNVATIFALSGDTMTLLTNGVTYRVRLMATTSAFPDPTNTPSEFVEMTPGDMAIRPSAPIVSSWAGTEGTLTVRYTILSDGGSPVTAVYYSTDSGLSWATTRTPNGTAVIKMTSDGLGPIVDSTTYGVRLLAVTVGFPSLSNPSSPTVFMVARPTIPGTFKPKGMSYTEFLRSKKADRVKILNTKPVRTASEITNARRLAASTVFALNNGSVKGSITKSKTDFAQGGLHAAQSYFKEGGAGRRVGSASEFTAFSGSQAIGGLAQAGLPPTRLLQKSNFVLVSAPVPQSAGDYLRREQGCKASLGQQHELTEVTPPKFVDNTIRNTGSPACVTRPAIHDIKAKNAFAYVPNRPSQAGGQYALKGDLAPGKELGAVGGNPNYKAGAALKNIPYVEKHHGNDLGVNPKRPFVKYQIPAGTPPHLKINRPKTIGGYVGPLPPPPAIRLADIAHITSPGVYTLNATTIIPVGYALTIPAGITLKIPTGLLLTNNGTIICQGTIDNDAMTNNGTFTIASTGTFVTTVLFTNSVSGTVTNSGAITISSTGTITNRGTITNTVNSTFVNNNVFTNIAGGVVNIRGTITISSTGTLTNSGSIALTSPGSIVNNHFITNNTGGTISNISGTITNNYTITNNLAASITNSGTFTNSATGTLTNSGGIVIGSKGTLTNNHIITINLSGAITNNGTVTNTLGYTFTIDGSYIDNGKTTNFVPLSDYATLVVDTTYTLNGDQTISSTTGLTLPVDFTLIIPETQTLTNNGTLILESPSIFTVDGTFENTGTVTASSGVSVDSTGIFINSGTFTTTGYFNNYGTVTNNATFTNDLVATNYATFTNSANATITNTYNFTNQPDSTFTNDGTLINTGTFLTYVPMSYYATLAGGNNYILNGDQTILSTNATSLPAGFTLVIPDSTTFTLNGELSSAGAITNNGTMNVNVALPTTGTIANNAGATINITAGLNSGGSDSSITNDGTINVNGSGAQIFNANGTFTNNGTINLKNAATWYASATNSNSAGGVVSVDGSSVLYIQNVPFTNHGTVTISGTININNDLLNDGTIDSITGSSFNWHTSTIYNYGGGVINTSGTIDGTGSINNADGGGACGAGTLGGTNPLTATGTDCPP